MSRAPRLSSSRPVTIESDTVRIEGRALLRNPRLRREPLSPSPLPIHPYPRTGVRRFLFPAHRTDPGSQDVSNARDMEVLLLCVEDGFNQESEVRDRREISRSPNSLTHNLSVRRNHGSNKVTDMRHPSEIALWFHTDRVSLRRIPG